MANPYLDRARAAIGATGATGGAPSPTAPTGDETAPTPETPSAPIDFDAPLTPEEQAELNAAIEAANTGPYLERPERIERARRETEQRIRSRRVSNVTGGFYEEAQTLAERLGEGGYDEERYGEYERTLNEPVESDFYKQAQSASAYLARTGLGSSGINIVAHQGLAQNKNAIENQGRRVALDMARNARRQEILDEFSTRLSALGPIMQKYGIDVSTFLAMQQMKLQQQMAEDQARASTLQSIGGIAGMGLGAYLGNPAVFAGGAMGGGYTGGGMGPGVPSLEEF